MSTGLRVVEPLPNALRPGSSAQLVFQAVDDYGQGVPDQRIEVVLTDLSRLHFSGSTDNRAVLLTGRTEAVQGLLLAGSVVVRLVVPDEAQPGSAALIASLAGDRAGNSTKTQWATFSVESGEGGAGGSGGEADVDGGTDSHGTGGIGGASGGEGN